MYKKAMANGEQHVAEFRDVVETVLEKHRRLQAAADAQSSLRRIRPNNTGLRAAGLVFAHILPRQGRSSVFGLRPKELWGVADQYEYKFKNHSGRMALLSSIELPGTLVRRVEFSGSAPLLGISTERELDKEEAALAVTWIKSPHLYPEIHNQLASLLPTEVEATGAEFAKQNEARDQYQRDMEAVRRASIPGPDFYNRTIG